jgi:hypothetical protein
MGWEGGATDMDTFSCFVLVSCCCSSSSSSLPSAVRMLRMLEEQEDAESRLPPRHEPCKSKRVCACRSLQCGIAVL